jgi:hypothetical protein
VLCNKEGKQSMKLAITMEIRQVVLLTPYGQVRLYVKISLDSSKIFGVLPFRLKPFRLKPFCLMTILPNGNFA